MTDHLLSTVRDVPDFPKPGILYKDITTLLNNPVAFDEITTLLAERYANQGLDYIVGIESRGFIFGAALATALKIGFVPIRKANKLPHSVYSEEYELEYGTDRIEMHQDAFNNKPAAKVLLIDDLLATGGTTKAAISLLEQASADCIEVACIMELVDLKGRDKLSAPVFSVLPV